MPCVETKHPSRVAGLLRSAVCCAALALSLSACQNSPWGSGSAPPSKGGPVAGSSAGSGAGEQPGEPSARPGKPQAATPNGPRGAEVRLPPPQTPRSWAEAREQAARRIVAANPERTYMGKPPTLLLAIPVLTVELHADGSVRQVSVMRHPSQARDTVKLATEAVHRAAPFGDVSRLPKPWRFNETFLFDDERKFKPMTLNQP